MLRPQGPDPVTGTGLTQQLETPTPTHETGQGGGSRDKIAGSPGQLPLAPREAVPLRLPCRPLPSRAVSVLPPPSRLSHKPPRKVWKERSVQEKLRSSGQRLRCVFHI